MREIRIAILGNVDSAKTTLVSTITNKILDDGRGFARAKVFKHKHEKETGRTSSISFRYVKVNEEKYISFIDLAGHEKYFKTTIHGLNGGLADYAILVVGANMGVLKMTREHLGIIKALQIPFFVVVTKLDICPPNILERTVREINNIVDRNFKKKLLICESNLEGDPEIELSNKLNNLSLTVKENVPLFKLSNVTGEGLDYFRNFLNNLSPRLDWDARKNKDSIYWIDNVYYVKGVGIVISGTVKNGEIRINDKMLLGPTDGLFKEVIVKSIHNNFREDISMLSAGLSGCVAVKTVNRKETLNKKKIKKGMVLLQNLKVENGEINAAVKEFTASITVLHHPTTIKENYEPVIHCGKVSQTARVISINKDYLRTGDKGVMKFRFKYRPEYLEKDDVLIFREGKTKGIGRILELGEKVNKGKK